jgi:hypothetical protein
MANIPLNDLYDIEDLALETGATVEYASGRRFNTSGREAVRKPKPVAAPAAPAAPAEPTPAKPDVSADLLRQMIAVLNRPVDVRLPEMPVPQVTVTPAAQVASKPVSWIFEFERNPNGTIKRINATPKE